MRSPILLRSLLLAGCLGLFWCAFRSSEDRAFTGKYTGSASSHGQIRQRGATQRRLSSGDSGKEPVFQIVSGAAATLTNQIEKISDGGVLTAVSKDGYSTGSHVWRVGRLAGLGIRTRIGVCVGNVSMQTNPTDMATDNSFWFYEETSGALKDRLAHTATRLLPNPSNRKLPVSMYEGDEVALILDCDRQKVHFYWPSGEEGLIEGLPSGEFKFFISVEDKGDSWQVTKEEMPKTEKVRKGETWFMQQYRKLPGF
eukprot:TRINITY_DN75866_c0_g1_i1.p1 TRINITY_DN75866_c0_g1~~TRINITY_DN75866_c0_g1_i1.p1  ORF type:complete len:255 (-),score=14.58 TRINITY_DN75866_c0_g1_i1:232-996(-)